MRSNRNKITLTILIAVLAAASFLYFSNFTSYNNKLENSSFNIQNKRRELFRDIYRGNALLVYPASDSLKYIESIKNLRGNFGRINLRVKSDKQVSANDLKENSIILPGTFLSNNILRKIAPDLPVIFSKAEFEFDEELYKKNSDLINLFYFNPYNKKKLCYIISGNDDKYIAGHIDLRSVGDLRISEGGQCAAMGFFKIDSGGKWEIDNSSYRDFDKEKREYNFSKGVSYTVYSNKLKRSDIEKINVERESSLQKMRLFFGKDFKVQGLKYYVYDNFEDKGLISGDTHLENADPSGGSVHFIYNNWISGNDFSQTALLYLRNNFGTAESRFIENGLSIYFSHDWRRNGYEFWAAKSANSLSIPSLKEMLHDESLQYLSPLVTGPLGGEFIKFLIKEKGRDWLIKNYTKINYKISSSQKFDEDWKSFLKKESANFKEELKEYKDNFPEVVPAFQKGFCFAHVGYQIYNGYLSREAYQSVLKMKVLGANSFSITPFTSMRNASEPEPLRFWEFPGAENDESVIFLAHTACDLNMYAMLKPHIYLGRSGWPGDIKMSDPDDWKLFFKDYYDWISHYAMIAEMYRIPILCLGNELAAATVGHENEWIDMVKKIRSFYDGKITYGPNWSGEFEKLTFWKYFDFIGLSEYYPLSEKENPTDSDLKNGAEDIMKRIGAVSEKYNKKIIFTEVGFRDSGRPWKTASEGSGRDSVNYRNQARCYEALFEAAHNKSWLAGMYWWKWPSYLSYGSETSRALYTPDNRPAERVVNKWYHRIK